MTIPEAIRRSLYSTPYTTTDLRKMVVKYGLADRKTAKTMGHAALLVALDPDNT